MLPGPEVPAVTLLGAMSSFPHAAGLALILHLRCDSRSHSETSSPMQVLELPPNLNANSYVCDAAELALTLRQR